MKFQIMSELLGKPVANIHFKDIRSGNRRRDITCEVESIHSIKDPYVSAYVHERLKSGLVRFTLRNDGIWRVVNSSYLALSAADDEGAKFLESTLAELAEENLSRKPRPKKLNPKYDLVPGRRYVAIDVETTGLDPFSGDRIIQLAALDITDFAHSNGELGQKMEAVVTKFNPQIPIPKEASAVNRIYDNDVAGSPLFSEYAEFLINFIGDAVLVGHNVRFDIDCLNAELDRLGKPRLQNDSYCTYRNARNKLEGRSNYRGRFNLEAVRKYLNVPSDGSWHDAFNDAKVAARLFNVLVRMNSDVTEKNKNSLVVPPNATSESKGLIKDQVHCEDFVAKNAEINLSHGFAPGRRYVAIDVKTTGPYNQWGERVIEFAALDIGELVNATGLSELRIKGLATRIQPSGEAQSEYSSAQGVGKDSLVDMPRFADHAEELVDFVGDAILIGHNAKLCVDLLNVELALLGKPSLDNSIFCTQKNSMIRFEPLGYSGEYTLEALTEFLGIERPAHTLNSVSNALVVYKLFNALVRMNLESSKSDQCSVMPSMPPINSNEDKYFKYFLIGLIGFLVVFVFLIWFYT